MQLEDDRVVTHETLETLQETAEGALVAARSAEGEELLLFVPRTAEIGALEAERLELLRGPGIAVPRPAGTGSSEAIVLEGASGARPLADAPPLPDSVWRPGLVRLLSALSQAHGKGLAHGRIAQGHVLVDPGGSFWIHGWSLARPAVGRGPFQTGLDDVARDVRDLGVEFVRRFADSGAAADADAGAALGTADVSAAVARVSLFDRELARVLARLVTADPREAYESATEVLSDLGERDQSLPDPWSELRLVGRARIVRRALACAERAGTADAYLGSFEIVGPPGSGRSRVLAEIAREARDRGMIVMQCQGGAPDQPWGAIGSLARQMLSRIPAGHPIREDRGTLALVGACSAAADASASAGDGASAALVELLAESFRGSRGVILLDDEDALSGHALRAWCALGRHVAGASGSSHAVPVLLVTTSARGTDPEPGTPRERVDLPDLSRRHVVHLVAGILTERGKATILANEISSVAGGRPGEIVEHLRDMLARGALTPVGRRFRLEDPADGVRSGGLADGFRRAAEAAGRDAVALAETLAVAGRLRILRDDAARIAELPAHRLQPAAEAALRAGLLVRAGAAWRVRTESLRTRLLAAMPDERRRGVHREILDLLLDAAEPDLPAIAHHGRAGGDPRAAEWTRRALQVLRDRGRFDEAAAHFDDARALLDPAALDVELRLVQVDTLLHAGRLDDAARCAQELSADPAADRRQRGLALLALARLHRYDQAWSKVLALEIPGDCGDPLTLARLRLLRAVAHVFRGRPDLADREERLADAELGGAGGAAACESQELAAIRATVAWDLVAGNKALIARLRTQAPRLRPLDSAWDYAQLANIRRLAGHIPAARAVLSHATRVASQRLPGNSLPLTWLANIRALVEFDAGNIPRQLRAAEAASLHATRSGCATLALNKRIELAHAQCRTANFGESARTLLNGALNSLHGLPSDVLSVSGARLAECALYCGRLGAMHELRRLTRQAMVPEALQLRVEYWWHVALLYIDRPEQNDVPWIPKCGQDVDEYDATLRSLLLSGTQHKERLACSSEEVPNSTLAIAGYLLRVARLAQREWTGAWSVATLLQTSTFQDATVHAASDFAFSVVLLPHADVQVDLRKRAVARALSAQRQVPSVIAWRRSLALARICWDAGLYRTAENLRDDAERGFAWLAESERAEVNAAAIHAVRTELARQGICLGRGRRGVGQKAARRGASELPAEKDTGLEVWREALRRACGGQRVLAICPDGASADWLVEMASSDFGMLRVRPGEARQAIAGCRSTLVLRCADEWSSDDEAALKATSGDSKRHAGGLVLAAALDEVRSAERSTRGARLGRALTGCVVLLPDLLASPARRKATFLMVLQVLRGSPCDVEPAAADALGAYAWPGGLSEAWAVAREVLRLTIGTIGLRELDLVGWGSRAIPPNEGCTSALQSEILRLLDGGMQLRSSEIARRTRRPLRSVVRALAELARHGQLDRSGRGRATTYHARARSAEAVHPGRCDTGTDEGLEAATGG